jgi:hypothetical protein
MVPSYGSAVEERERKAEILKRTRRAVARRHRGVKNSLAPAEWDIPAFRDGGPSLPSLLLANPQNTK